MIFSTVREQGRRWAIATNLFVALLAITLLGCSKPPYEVAPVTGRVLIDGKPFSGGKVQFAPVGAGGTKAGKPGFGLLDEQGEFLLTTYREGDGAVVGQHWITLLSLPDRRTAADSHVPSFRRMPAVKTPVEVVAGQDNRFEVALTLDEVREYTSQAR